MIMPDLKKVISADFAAFTHIQHSVLLQKEFSVIMLLILFLLSIGAGC